MKKKSCDSGLVVLETALNDRRQYFKNLTSGQPVMKQAIAREFNEIRNSILKCGGEIETLDGDPPIDGSGGDPGEGPGPRP